MSDVSAWSQTAAGNATTPPDGFPEGMDRQDLNDSDREQMAGVRRAYEDPEWVDLLKEGGPAADFTVSKTNDTTINIVHDVTPTDATSKFPVGARIRLDDGATKLVGFVTSRSYAAPNTSVVVDIDGGTAVQAGVNKAETHVTKGDMGRAAWSPLGVTIGADPPQVVKIDDFSDPQVVVELNKATGIDADTVDGFHAADLFAAINEESLLLNGGFSCWQRGLTIDQTTTFKNDNAAYTSDQWVLLMGKDLTHPATGVVDLTRDFSDLPDGVGGYAMKITGNGNVDSPTAEKVGLFQLLTREHGARLNNGKASVSFWAKTPAGSDFNKLQVAIIEWQGAIDDPSSIDPIADWKGPGVEPTVASSFTITSSVGAGGFSPTDTWTEFKLENVTVSSSMNNVGVLIWIDDQSWAEGAIVRITGVTIAKSTVAHSFVPMDEASELRRCEYFFESTFEPTEEPQQNLGNANGAALGMGNRTNGDVLLNWDFRTPKFKTPTIVTYNPNAANANARNLDDGNDHTVATQRLTKRKVNFEITPASGNDGDVIAIHASAEAVLS